MAKTRRSYQGGAISTTTGTSIAASGATTFTITAYTGWPYGSAPFFVVVEPGTSNEEKMLVTRSGSTDTTISIYATPSVASNRGMDGTTAFLHASGSTIFPVFTATDADEANEIASTLTTQGDILIHGASTFGRVGIGTAAQVLRVNSSATAPEWGQIATAGIADDAITAAKIATGAVGADEIAANAVGASELADNAVDTAAIVNGAVTADKLDTGAVTSTKILDGTILNEDINASANIAHTKLAATTPGHVLLGTTTSGVVTGTAISGDITISSAGVAAIASGVIVDADVKSDAAIALSKLATGALPTAITIASANITANTITSADCKADGASTSIVSIGAALPSATSSKIRFKTTAGAPTSGGAIGDIWFVTA